MSDAKEEPVFTSIITRLKSEWNLEAESSRELSEKARRSLFLRFREIESENNSSIPWEVFLNYLPRFSMASAFSAALCIVTFQLSHNDLSDMSLNEHIDSDYSELIVGSDLVDEGDSVDLIIDEQQDGDV